MAGSLSALSVFDRIAALIDGHKSVELPGILDRLDIAELERPAAGSTAPLTQWPL